MKKKIDENTKISEILEENPEASEKFFEKGLFCIGCPMSSMETVKEAAESHGLDVGELLKELNEVEDDVEG